MSMLKFLRNPFKLFNNCPSNNLCNSSFVCSKDVLYSKSLLLGDHKLNVCYSLLTVPSLKFHTSKCQDQVVKKNQSKLKKTLPVEDPSKPLVKITFIKSTGEEVEIQARVGLTVMQEALKNKLPIEGACNGQLACTTCHVYVERSEKKNTTSGNPKLGDKTLDCSNPDINEYSVLTFREEDLLDSAPFVQRNSRLCCQLVVTENYENARFKLPKATVNFMVDKKDSENS